MRPSVRARLTLWHAGVLALIIGVFAAALFVFVRARLYHALDSQIALDLASVQRVYREEPGDLAELDHRMGLRLFEVREGDTVIYRTPAWPPPASYRTGTLGDATHTITIARDDAVVRQALRALAVTLGMAIRRANHVLRCCPARTSKGRTREPNAIPADYVRRRTTWSTDPWVKSG